MWFPRKELGDTTLTAGVRAASILLAAKQMLNAIFFSECYFCFLPSFIKVKILFVLILLV